MPTPTYTPLATVTLGSAAASVTFSSIPATYRDLVIVFDASITSGATADYQVLLNSSTTTYNQSYTYGNGTTISGFTESNLSYAPLGRASTAKGVQVWNFMDYSANDRHKIILDRGNAAGADLLMRSVRWNNTSVITSIQIALPGTTIAAGTTVNLYGIAS
jgi:hypothetical protein